jgi:non-ribosomal peptide synthetase component E (peptide arylation enzyme)
MAKYKIPRKLVILDSIPRNAMGKINKKELLK